MFAYGLIPGGGRGRMAAKETVSEKLEYGNEKCVPCAVGDSVMRMHEPRCPVDVGDDS